MSARSDQSKSLFSVLAICMFLAGGAFIASTDVGAQTERYYSPRHRAQRVDQPSYLTNPHRANPAKQYYTRRQLYPCGRGSHMHLGKDGNCYID